jgi:hypothetical protein
VLLFVYLTIHIQTGNKSLGTFSSYSYEGAQKAMVRWTKNGRAQGETGWEYHLFTSD